MSTRSAWPTLALGDWQDTLATLHMAMQMVGKVRLAGSPMTNQWWQVPLYLTGRGLATTAIPSPAGVFDLELDLVAHAIVLRTSAGDTRQVPLAQRVKETYRQLMEALAACGLDAAIWPQPVEVANPIRFDADDRHAYDPAAVSRFFSALTRIEPVFKTFRARFRGKCSPVQFYWGSCDLAVSRFSGRMAPPREGADRITRLAYDEEVSSLGFWPGGEWPGAGHFEACFYAYTTPKPDGLEQDMLGIDGATWEARLGEFMLPYEAVRTSSDPAGTLLAFAQAAYEAGARRAGWDTEALAYRPERAQPRVTFAPEVPVPAKHEQGL